MNKNQESLRNDPIGKLILKFSLPAIAGMMIQALYNIVDTIFVGQGVGTTAIAALSIAFPIQIFITSVGVWIGIGGSAIISRKLGEKDYEGAEKTFGNMLIPGFFIAVALIAALYAFAEPILSSLGASDVTLPEALTYLYWVIPSTLFIVFKMIGNNAIRSEGNPRFPMMVMFIGAGLNIALDPIFIFALDWGIMGAALATSLSQGISAVVCLSYFFREDSFLKLKISEFHFSLKAFWEILVVGSASFVQHILMSVVQVFINLSALKYGGDIAVAFFGAFMRLLSFFMMPVIGLMQGGLTIIGFSYGAKAINRVKETYAKVLISGTVFAFLFGGLMFLFPQQTIRIFNDDPELLAIAGEGMRIMVSGLVLAAFQMISSGTFQAFGKGGKALVLSLMRQGIVLIPAVLILPRIWGLTGLFLAYPISDLISAAVTGIFAFGEARELKAMERSLEKSTASV